MRLYLLALNPTDSVTQGFLPAAARLGLTVTVLTDHAEPHRRAYAGSEHAPEVLECAVRDHREVIALISRLPRPDAVFSNSDHLQEQTALAAGYFGLPAKDWRAALRTKNKAELRRHLAAAGLDHVHAAELPPGLPPAALAPPFPCVVKPREGVASEDVVLAEDADALAAAVADIRTRRPDAALVVEEYLAGELHTLETLGDGTVRHVLGGFHTRLSPPPQFVEEALVYLPAHPEAVTAQVLAQLDALGVGLGACHTEFVLQADGRVRLVEVNYRAIGDTCDLMLAELLEIPFFEHVLNAHLGVPLPAELGARTDRRARNQAVIADRAGTLTAAPGPYRGERDGVTLSYQPARELGESRPLSGTNRDYLGLVRAVGPDQRSVDRAVDDFLAAHRWEITG
ncbi:acetyl-CoA carboxylase biotin carboxylase subunit family protein [Kitasatospora sp. NPDC096147]|uniref:ATP-grasp domain-containing protein n=1 Tax=Kitasatospora sp. NPDC096147 TaxID=3364093 RepID=UPI00382BE8C0